MECFFGSYPCRSEFSPDGKRLVCFAIPAAGITFKAPFAGEELHTEYASLLTLLEFIELNQKLFLGQDLKIYGNNLEMINQVNLQASCHYEFSELLRKALDYRERYHFSLGWVPQKNNPATHSLFD